MKVSTHNPCGPEQCILSSPQYHLSPSRIYIINHIPLPLLCCKYCSNFCFHIELWLHLFIFLWWPFLFDYICNELKSKNGECTYEKYSIWLKVTKSTSSLNFWGKKTYLLFRNETGRHMPLIWTTPSAERLYKLMEEGRFCLLPAYPHLASIYIPSLALKPTSSGFWHVQKTSWDT